MPLDNSIDCATNNDENKNGLNPDNALDKLDMIDVGGLSQSLSQFDENGD